MFITLLVLFGQGYQTLESRVKGLDPRIRTLECDLEGEYGPLNEQGEWRADKAVTFWVAHLKYHRDGALLLEFQTDAAPGKKQQISVRHGFDMREIRVFRGKKVQTLSPGNVLHALNDFRFRGIFDTWPQLASSYLPADIFRGATFYFNDSQPPLVKQVEYRNHAGKLDQKIEITMTKVVGDDGITYEIPSTSKRLVYGEPDPNSPNNLVFPKNPSVRFDFRIPYASIQINKGFTPESLDLTFDPEVYVEDTTKQSLPPAIPSGKMRTAKEIATATDESKQDFERRSKERYSPAGYNWSTIIAIISGTMLVGAIFVKRRSR